MVVLTLLANYCASEYSIACERTRQVFYEVPSLLLHPLLISVFLPEPANSRLAEIVTFSLQIAGLI
jgi:hypothetical protein